MKNWKGTVIISIVITAILAGIAYYLILPPFNPKSILFWIFVGGIFGCMACICGITWAAVAAEQKISEKLAIKHNSPIKADTFGNKKLEWFASVTAILALLCFIGVAVVGFFSSTVFHAGKYSKLLEVQEDCVFEEDFSESFSTDAIAIMDTESAQMLGNRKLGSLSDLVSQYNVSEYYSQINYQNTPVKVAALDYAGFFKYFKNKKNGVPGYIMVSPVNMSAEYVSLQKNMNYVPSAYFSKDLYRHIRSEFRTQMIRDVWFEINEDGEPYYVASVVDHTIGVFGGEDVLGAILIDPVSGDMEYFEKENVPTWIDIVYDGNLLCEQYDYFGELRNGFWNSVFSAEGCKVTTTDYGYVAKDNDIWVYTGVTSVNSDASNIGFVMMNERTGEAKFYTCAGADEYSAMAAAEGEVQQFGYSASFPSLINVEGDPTYIMVLKDAGGLVKMYAAVNAEQYNMVVTANTQKECIDKYTKMMKNGTIDNETTEQLPVQSTQEELDDSLFVEKDIVIKKLAPIVSNGDTYLYVVTEDGEIYHAKYVDVLQMLTVQEKDSIKIRVYEDWFKTIE